MVYASPVEAAQEARSCQCRNVVPDDYHCNIYGFRADVLTSFAYTEAALLISDFALIFSGQQQLCRVAYKVLARPRAAAAIHVLRTGCFETPEPGWPSERVDSHKATL